LSFSIKENVLFYPHINPIALHLGHLQIHWYGVMYLIGFTTALVLGCIRSRHPKSKIRPPQIVDLIFYAAVGAIVGGRAGYALFYNLSVALSHPLFIFRIWEGGMSFHGGLIGVIVAFYLFAKKINQPFLVIGDFAAPLAPIGIGLGRIGNFINAELPGRITNVAWGMVYPNAGTLPRHPSSIYEAFFEGIILFTIIWIYSRHQKPTGSVSALFLISYGVIRIGCEFFREPDPQLGFIFGGFLTMGQILSLLMVVAGIVIYWTQTRGDHPAT
jgi:phosphatidylglycerol---prolipoprotein diacylglyceryl transferase